MSKKKEFHFEHHITFFKEISVFSSCIILFLLTILFFAKPDVYFFLKYIVPSIGVLCGIIILGFSGWMFLYCLEGFMNQKILLHGGDILHSTLLKGKIAKVWSLVGMGLSIYFALLCLFALWILFYIFVFLST